MAESANGVKYLYDINPIKKVGQPVKSGTSTTLVGQSVKSDTSTTGDIVAQNQTESQAQIRSSTLSDQDVLQIAAQMAKNSESMLDIKRTIPLLRSSGLTIASRQLLRNGYIGSITYAGQNVNIKGLPFSSVVGEGDVQFSLRDSEGRSLTEAQQDYFKDSEVRDAPAAGVRGRRTGAGPHQCRTARTTGSIGQRTFRIKITPSERPR